MGTIASALATGVVAQQGIQFLEAILAFIGIGGFGATFAGIFTASTIMGQYSGKKRPGRPRRPLGYAIVAIILLVIVWGFVLYVLSTHHGGVGLFLVVWSAWWFLYGCFICMK